MSLCGWSRRPGKRLAPHFPLPASPEN
jgi:hypothetical protein